VSDEWEWARRHRSMERARCLEALHTVIRDLDVIDGKIRAEYPSDTWYVAHKVIKDVYTYAQHNDVHHALVASEPLILMVPYNWQSDVIKLRNDLKAMEKACEHMPHYLQLV